MKKLLFLALIAVGFVQDASAMVFKKTKDGRYLPAFLGKFDLRKDQNASEAQGFSLNALEGLEGDARKEAIKAQCDEFKKNSKKPEMWNQHEEVEESKIEKIYNCVFQKKQGQNLACNLEKEFIELNAKDFNFLLGSDFKFLYALEKLQKNEWKQWQRRTDNKIMGIAVDYQGSTSSVDSTKACIEYDQSPYHRIVIEDPSNNIGWGNVLENNCYHESLQSLQVMEEVIKSDLHVHDLHNQSYLQRWWNYGKRQRTHKALELVQNEITSFKQPENREAFTRSAMPEDLFKKVKTARE